MKAFWILLIAILIVSCENAQTYKKEEVAAQVGDKVLLKKDIPDLFQNLSSEDSLKIAEKYVQNWVKKELLLKRAEINLTQNQQEQIICGNKLLYRPASLSTPK